MLPSTSPDQDPVKTAAVSDGDFHERQRVSGTGIGGKRRPDRIVQVILVFGHVGHLNEFRELLELRDRHPSDDHPSALRLEQYLDTWYRGETREKLMKLATFDSRDAAMWPEFDKFHASLNTSLA